MVVPYAISTITSCADFDAGFADTKHRYNPVRGGVSDLVVVLPNATVAHGCVYVAATAEFVDPKASFSELNL